MIAWDKWIDRPEGRDPKRGRVTRRGLGALGLGAGYALAAQPVSAQTAITTDMDGIETRKVTLNGFDGFAMPAFAARPTMEGGPFPAVIVVNEIFGLHAYIQDICRRFAKAGYFALAPGYFERAGDPSEAKDFAAVREIVAQAGQDQVLKDTDTAFRWLETEPSADADRVGITGFCWGGNVVWMFTAREPKIKAGAAWYGRLAKPAQDESDRVYPIDVADQMTGRVLGLYGGQDRGIPVSDVEAMRAALKAAGDETSEIILYDDAQHGFHADYRPSYDAAAAKDGWARLMAWFAERGVA
ncbi:MAG: dienelactone hydrolase family protein [Maricaulaceae bacterium]